MSSRKKSNDKTRIYFDPDYRKNPSKAGKEPFARCYASLLKAPQFIALSKNAQRLYLCMIASSGGDFEFTFPRRVYHDEFGFGAQSFRDAKNMLADAGFILERRQEKSDSFYQFSTTWMEREPREKKTSGRDNLEAMIEGKKRKAEERKRAEQS